MSEAVYPIVFWSGMALLVSVIIAGFFYIVGRGEGIREQKEAEATARAARNSKPGDLISCRDPRAVAEALRNGSPLGSLFLDEKGHAYRLPASPREEIAYAAMLAIAPHTDAWLNGESRSKLVSSCFELADEFIAQADGMDA